jgi:hypothetical protein
MPHSNNNMLEIAKISISDEHQHFLFKPEVMDDPIDWGYLLADFARLLANSYQESQNSDSNSVLTRILEGFQAEIKSPALQQEPPQIINYPNFK